ncbi:MAG: caspase family protein [Ferruginibacter sp.]
MARKALIIGIDGYINSPLKSCVNDANKLAQALQFNANKKDKNFDIERPDQRIKTKKAYSLIENFFKKDDQSEVCIFYFSGHGKTTNTSQSQIIFQDYDEHGQGILFDSILELANNSQAKNKIIILDCCYSGGAGSPSIFGRNISVLGEGVTVMAASQSDEKAIGEENLSLFTNLLLKGLEGRAANEKGEITTSSLFYYIDQNLNSLQQRPVYKTNTITPPIIKKIDFLKALNFVSKRIAEAITFQTDSTLLVTVVYQLEDYLNLLATTITEATKEVLFTSSRMADSSSQPYGDLQKKIIENSSAFKARHPYRRHFGIIAKNPKTFEGAFELRKAVNDVVLRFHDEIDSLNFNFFICDDRKVVIRMKEEKNQSVNYAVLIENAFLAKSLKKYFFELWNNSSTMVEYIQPVLNKGAEKKNNILNKVFNGRRIELNELIEKLKQIDSNFVKIPELVNDKHFPILPPIEKLSGHKSVFFSLIAKRIEGASKKTEITIEKLQTVYNNIDNPKKAIDYSMLGLSFAYKYFLANYYKVLHSFIEFNTKFPLDFNELNILDLGGGGGASVTAMVDFFKIQKIKKVKITVVDSSKDQINLVKYLFSNHSFGPNVEYKTVEAAHFFNSKDLKFDLVVASNFLCEILEVQKFNDLLKKIRICLEPNAKLIVVEQLESGVYNKIMDSGQFNLMHYKFDNERFFINDISINELIKDISKKHAHLEEYIKKQYTLRYAIFENRNS